MTHFLSKNVTTQNSFPLSTKLAPIIHSRSLHSYIKRILEKPCTMPDTSFSSASFAEKFIFQGIHHLLTKPKNMSTLRKKKIGNWCRLESKPYLRWATSRLFVTNIPYGEKLSVWATPYKALKFADAQAIMSPAADFVCRQKSIFIPPSMFNPNSPYSSYTVYSPTGSIKTLLPSAPFTPVNPRMYKIGKGFNHLLHKGFSKSQPLLSWISRLLKLFMVEEKVRTYSPNMVDHACQAPQSTNDIWLNLPSSSEPTYNLYCPNIPTDLPWHLDISPTKGFIDLMTTYSGPISDLTHRGIRWALEANNWPHMHPEQVLQDLETLNANILLASEHASTFANAATYSSSLNELSEAITFISGFHCLPF